MFHVQLTSCKEHHVSTILNTQTKQLVNTRPYNKNYVFMPTLRPVNISPAYCCNPVLTPQWETKAKTKETFVVHMQNR